MKRKGFTLIELLAVIIILAIILIIVVPNVINIIEGTRQNAFRASVRAALETLDSKLVGNKETQGRIEALGLSGEPLYGIWEYDPDTKTVYVCDVSGDNYRLTTTLSAGDYSPSGRSDCVSSDNETAQFAVTRNPSISTLASVLVDSNLGAGRVDTNGYIIDTDND